MAPPRGTTLAQSVEADSSRRNVSPPRPSTAAVRQLPNPAAVTQSRMRTLVADEDATSRALLEQVLGSRGHDVTACADADTAWTLCQADPPALLLVSSSLLETHGVPLTRRIRAIPGGDRTVILALTASDQPSAMQALLQAGCNDYLMRPLDEALLKVRLAIAELGVRQETRAKHTVESARRLSFAVDQSPAAVIIADPKGNIDYVNPKFTQLTGFSHAEILGSRLLELSDLTLEEKAKFWETVDRGLEWRGEFRYKRRNGDYYWASASISPARGTNGKTAYLVEVHEDITERKRVEDALRAGDERYRALADNAYDLICEISVDGRFLYVSRNYREVLGYETDDLVGREIFALIHPEDRPRVMESFVRAVQSEAPGGPRGGQLVFRYRHKNGQYRWFESVGRAYRSADRESRRLVVARDITERKRAEDQQRELTERLQTANTRLETMTLVDPLTELLNRRGLQQVLTREIDVARRASTELFVLFVDLDDFKGINDKLGYAVGDVVLKEVARKLRASMRGTDHVARIGGDEFMVLLPRSRTAEAIRVAERARIAVSGSPVFLSSGTVNVTASLGLARVAHDTPSIDELLSQTHVLLRQSKLGGKNRLSYDVGVHETENDASTPQGDLIDLLRRGEGLKTVFHAIYRLADEVIVGHECLTRSTIPAFERPDHFFRISQEANILTPVDHHCFKTAIAATADRDPSLRFHINLLPSTMIDIPVQHLLEVFPANRPRSSYCIEISEQQIIGDPSYLREPVSELKRAGVLIAIDDVGFGRSCLESMVLLEPDIVKIDRKVVSGIGSDPSRATMLKRIFHVAKVLGADVVAEGIENREELRILLQLGVSYGQGFLWGKPA